MWTYISFYPRTLKSRKATISTYLKIDWNDLSQNICSCRFKFQAWIKTWIKTWIKRWNNPWGVGGDCFLDHIAAQFSMTCHTLQTKATDHHMPHTTHCMPYVPHQKPHAPYIPWTMCCMWHTICCSPHIPYYTHTHAYIYIYTYTHIWFVSRPHHYLCMVQLHVMLAHTWHNSTQCTLMWPDSMWANETVW